jgi:glutaredoxin-like protein NrdH
VDKKEMKYIHQEGNNCGKVILFAISTCIWCKKTKRLLDSLKIAYDFIDVDLASKADKLLIRKEIKKWTARASYPFIIIDDRRYIQGYQEDQIKEIVKHGK